MDEPFLVFSVLVILLDPVLELIIYNCFVCRRVTVQTSTSSWQARYGIAGLTCSLSTEKEQVLNSSENPQN